MTCCSKNPDLLSCDEKSFFLSVLAAAQAGLPLDGYHAHLIPYGREATFVPDYKGLTALASGNGIAIHADVVMSNDYFLDERGLDPRLVHKPFVALTPGERQDLGLVDESSPTMRAAYAVATMPNGLKTHVVMYADDIDKRRKFAPGSSHPKSPWVKWPKEMWKKTVIKAVLKRVPRDPRLMRAIQIDDSLECGLYHDAVSEQTIEDLPETERETNDSPSVAENRS